MQKFIYILRGLYPPIRPSGTFPRVGEGLLSDHCVIRPYLLLCAAWIIVIFFDEHVIKKLFLSNVIAIGFMLFALVNRVIKKTPGTRLLLFTTGLILAISGYDYYQFGAQLHFNEELVKSLLILSGGIAISNLYSTETFAWILKPFPVVLAAYLFIQFFIIGAPDSCYRLALDRSLGCANTIGYLMGFATIILLYAEARSTPLKWLLILFFCVLIANTYSRSAILGLTGGIVLTFLFRRKSPLSSQDWLSLLVPLLIIGTLAIMAQFSQYTHYLNPPTLVSEVHQSYAGGIHRFNIAKADSAGRIGMWIVILQVMLQHPESWLTGFGPGLVPQLNLMNNHYLSIDSILVKFLYSYGLIGLTIAVLFCVRLLRPQSAIPHYFNLKSILGLFMVFTLITNDTTSASPAILYGMLLIGFILSREQCKN